MTGRLIDVVFVRAADDVWTSPALGLPKARLASLRDAAGAAVAYTTRSDGIVAIAPGSTLFGNVELPEELVETSLLERTRVDLEREKLASEERAGRRTIWVSLATALVSAIATISVAWIANSGTAPPVERKSAPNTYRDLSECRESLNRLASLAQLDRQTLQNLRDAIGRHVDECDDRLNTAILQSPP